MRFEVYPDRDLMMIDVAEQLADELTSVLLHEDTAVFSVPGGTTPAPVFEAMSAVDLHWDRVRVLLNDERWVPETSERSNTALLKRHLLKDKAAAATLLPLYADAPAPEDRLDELSAAITPHLPISVLLLGMGDDMHTASLFPGADRLAEALDDHAPVLLPMRAPNAPEPRITLSAPVLKGALNIHVLIKGASKRAALERAAELDDPMQAPVSAILKNATVHWAE